jgi:signal transduction histidine kinase
VAIGIIILSIITILLISYIVLLQRQIKHINNQLNRRIERNTRQPISLEFINNELNQLTININKCLKAEENLRLESVREDKRFKELITNISHDLRTPLTAIKGYLQLMEKGELNEEQKSKLLIAKKHTEKLGNLIEHFYEYTYLENGIQEPKSERINLNNLVADCLVDSIHSFEELNIAIDYIEGPQIFIMGDKEMVMRIVQNLIRNCLQHSFGTVTVRLFVKENGIISFQNPVNENSTMETDRLFDRFYVGDKARSNSTGLGLSIVKLLAEQMHGFASASKQGNMLEISVSLPLYNQRSVTDI